MLYILTFGLGLGQTQAVDGRAYLDFLLPGVVALTIMNSSFNGIGMSLNVQRLYEHIRPILSVPSLVRKS